VLASIFELVPARDIEARGELQEPGRAWPTLTL
jgi:hypothetical protein